MVLFFEHREFPWTMGRCYQMLPTNSQKHIHNHTQNPLIVERKFLFRTIIFRSAAMLNFQGVYCCWEFRNSAHQLSLLVYPIICDQFYIDPRWLFGISEASTVSLVISLSHLLKASQIQFQKINLLSKMIGKRGSPTTSLTGPSPAH